MALFRNTVSADAMRTYWSRVGPKSNMAGLLIRKQCEDTGKECDDRDRDGRHAAATRS